MGIKKTIISFLLLCIYFVGLAHEVIPHCHHDDNMHDHGIAMEESHSHSQHQHVIFANSFDSETTNHDHYHEEGFLDFLTCLLSETDHPVSECNQLYYPTSLKNAIDGQIHSVVLPDGISQNCQSSGGKLLLTNEHSNIDKSGDLLLSSPFRGPPSVFI